MLLSNDFLERLAQSTGPAGRVAPPGSLHAHRLRARSHRTPADPLCEFVQDLFAVTRGPIVFVVDGTQTMTFAGDAPPIRSGKFPFALRLVGAIGAAALHVGIPVHLVPVGAVSGRRGPVLRHREQLSPWLMSLEEFRPGGARQFRYALRNQILRGGPDASVLVVSDFRNEGWASALPALVAGESRVALVHVVDEHDAFETESRPQSRVPFVGGSHPSEEDDVSPVIPSAIEIHQLLHDMALEHRMELLGVHDTVPVEASVLRAVEALR